MRVQTQVSLPYGYLLQRINLMNSAIAKKKLQRRTAIYFENLQLLYIFKPIKGLEGIYNKLRLK